MDQDWKSSDVPPVILSGGEGDLPEAPLSKWPTVIGIIGIVLASLGLFCGCVGYFQIPLQKWGARMAAQSGMSDPMMEAQIKVAEQFQIIMLILLTIGMILTIWLLAGSIKLVRRRASARNHLIGWAMASLFVLAINIALQVLMFQATVNELTQAGASDRVPELWFGAMVGGFFMIIFGLAFQTFILIWFSRSKIKAEMQGWRS